MTWPRGAAWHARRVLSLGKPPLKSEYIHRLDIAFFCGPPIAFDCEFQTPCAFDANLLTPSTCCGFLVATGGGDHYGVCDRRSGGWRSSLAVVGSFTMSANVVDRTSSNSAVVQFSLSNTTTLGSAIGPTAEWRTYLNGLPGETGRLSASSQEFNWTEPISW